MKFKWYIFTWIIGRIVCLFVGHRWDIRGLSEHKETWDPWTGKVTTKMVPPKSVCLRCGRVKE